MLESPVEIKKAIHEIALLIMGDKLIIDTLNGSKNIEGIKDIIYLKLKESLGNTEAETIWEYFEI